MAVSLAPPTTAPAHPTLLSTLRAFTRLLETRRSLQAELDLSLSSFLAASSSSNSGTSDPTDVLSAPRDPAFPPPSSSAPSATPQSTCAAEALSPPPPSEPELAELLKIAFGGLVEVKEEARALGEEVGGRWGRKDLQRVVERIEAWESERVKATLEQYQLRRLLALDASLYASLADTLKEKDALRADLAVKIQEELQEVQAEIADLSAAAEGEQEGATGVKA
ncbi:hypothetical protein JCM10207_001113 [Rhodosporidiobolus poonsookiae]